MSSNVITLNHEYDIRGLEKILNSLRVEGAQAEMLVMPTDRVSCTEHLNQQLLESETVQGFKFVPHMLILTI